MALQRRRGDRLWGFVGSFGGVGATNIVMSFVYSSGANDEALRVVGVASLLLSAVIAAVAVKLRRSTPPA